jgi:hypothetical protein
MRGQGRGPPSPTGVGKSRRGKQRPHFGPGLRTVRFQIAERDLREFVVQVLDTKRQSGAVSDNPVTHAGELAKRRPCAQATGAKSLYNHGLWKDPLQW